MSASREIGSSRHKGQARLEELIRDAKLGKKIKQVKLLILFDMCDVCNMWIAWLNFCFTMLDAASEDSIRRSAMLGLVHLARHPDAIPQSRQCFQHIKRLIPKLKHAMAAQQGGKERRFGSDPFDFVPPGVTPQDFMFGDGPLLGPTRG